MTVRYEGKSPGKLWYTWQKTKGMFATKQYKPFAKNTTGAGLSATGTVLIQQQLATVLAYLPLGLAGLGGMAVYNAFKAIRPGNDAKNKVTTGDRWKSALKYGGAAAALAILTPTAATWVSLGLIGATGYFGLRGFQSWKAAAQSTDVRNYVRKQEGKWLDNKQAGTLRQRLTRKIKSIGTHIKMGVMKTLKFGSIGTGIAATAATALGVAQYYGAGLLSASAASSVTAAITTAGAAIGIAAAPALITAAVIVAAAIPVSAVVGLVAHHKIREIRAAREGNAPTGNRFMKKKPVANDDTPENAAPSTRSNDNAPKAAEGFNAHADKEPAKTVAKEEPKPQPKPEEDEALSEARRAAAEARRANRRKGSGSTFG